MNNIEISLINSVLFIMAEFISPATLAATAMLKIFEPTILPIMKSVLFFLADSIVAASSGRPVSYTHLTLPTKQMV